MRVIHILRPHVRRKHLVGHRLKIIERRLALRVNPRQPLHAARANEPRHHHAQRRAVRGRQRLAIHFVGQQHFFGARFVNRNRAAEAEGFSVARHFVQSGELHVPRSTL